ncbi:molybdopterin biosynthesis protein [Erysipelotrichaceae bacterium OttesenSCG-928-M19]|nr:molybdopterin biosynthesis protein [Erysipelotrichaceae bacterium OttesenSCG-928-M19]
MKERKIYLDNYDLDQAIEKYLEDIKEQIQLEVIEIPAADSLHYITAEAIYAKLSSPHYNASAMDGIAIKANLSNDANESNPVVLKKNEYQYVDTGDVITKEYDAVVMIEDIVVKDDESVVLTKPVAFFENVRAIGEDISQMQMIVPSYHQIRAEDINAILASKNDKIKVFKKLKVGIIPTGSEIVSVATKELEAGMIIDSNSSMLKALVLEKNLAVKVYDITKDDYNLLKQVILDATNECDVVLINAGSSAGSEDYTAMIIEELGKISVHGIAIKPGKPAILGSINQAMVIGLPGYPVATYIVFKQVFLPIIDRLYHQSVDYEIVEATLSKTIYSSLKHIEFVRVKLGYVNEQFIATPLARGAGISMSLAEADGLIVIEKESEGYQKNSTVKVVLLKAKEQLKERLTVIGSHDLILDIVQDVINETNKDHAISSSHVGSYSGLLALKNHECDLAPIHILAADGKYNEAIVKEIFKEEKMALIKGVKRRQVLAYPKNNPKNIRGINDLTRSDIRYVNRQPGSGTAILLDYLLKEKNIALQKINGYDFIMPSHFNVGATIKNETADCGLLIKSVADVLELDYIEVMAEEYDFLIYQKDLDKLKIKTFIEILRSQNFKDKLAVFDCYETLESGQVIKIG